jgi:uncharacterized protein (UPF0332 family)
VKRETRTKAPRRKPLEHERKKAPARERAAPLQPLSENERKYLIDFEHAVAEIHLKEAIAIQAWGGAPNACVHAAYYGMYHAATAVLHIAGGVGKAKHVPKSHEHVLEHFTTLALTAGPDGAEAAKLLNRARSVRMTSDYGGAEPPDDDEIEQCVVDACRFVEICVQLLGLAALELPASPAQAG